MSSVVRTMQSLGLLTVAALISAATLEAKDLCLDAGGSIYVGRGMKIPPKGKCGSWRGFCSNCVTDINQGSPTDNAQTGTLCTAADGSHVDIAITTVLAEQTTVGFDYFKINLPDKTGLNDFYGLTFGPAGQFPATLSTCNTAPALTASGNKFRR